MVSKEEREAKATLWLQRLQGAEAAERVARSCTSLDLELVPFGALGVRPLR